jgi:hypothetical protein
MDIQPDQNSLLPYRSGADDRRAAGPRVPFAGQAAIGFLAYWVLVGLAFAGAIQSGQIALILLGCVVGLYVVLRVIYRWRGFLPGFLAGIGLSVLILLCVCALQWE